MMRRDLNIVVIESPPRKECTTTECNCPKNIRPLLYSCGNTLLTVGMKPCKFAEEEDKRSIEQLIREAEMYGEESKKKKEMEKAVSKEKETINDWDFELPPKPLIVFIYDVDFVTQLTWENIEKIAKLYPTLQIGCEALEDFLDTVSEHFSWLNKREKNVMHVTDAVEDEETKQEYRYLEVCAEMYGTLIKREFTEEMESPETYAELCNAVEKFKEVFNKPLETMKQCLKLSSDYFMRKAGANIVITEDPLEHGVAQLLTFGMSTMVPLENVYSTYRKSRQEVLKRIMKKYENAAYTLVVSSNDRTIKEAKKLNIPIWPLDQKDSLNIFYNVQREYLLK